MPAIDEQRVKTGRRRRAQWATAVLAVVTLLGVLLFGPLLIVSIAPVRGWLLDSGPLSRILGQGVRLRIDQVSRFDAGGFAFGGVELQVRDPQDPQGEWCLVARAGRLSASWSIRQLLVGHIHIHALEATPLTVSLDGISVLRASRESGDGGAGGPGAPGKLLRISTRHLRVAPFEVVDSSGVVLRGGLLHSELSVLDKEISFRLHEAWVSAERMGLDLELSQGRALWLGNSAVLRDLVFEGSRARGIMHMRYEPLASDTPLRVDLALDHLDPRLLAERFVPALDLWAEDSLFGSVQLRQGPGGAGVVLELVMGGMLLGEELNECCAVVTIESGRLSFDEVIIGAQACDLQGSACWNSAQRRLAANLTWTRLDPRSRWLPWLRHMPVEESFAGAGDVTVAIPRKAPPRVEGCLDVRGAHPWRIGARRIRFRGSVEPGSAVRADDLQVFFPEGELRAKGEWPLGPHEVDLSVQFDSIPLAVLPEPWRLGIDGRVWGRIHVGGVAEDPVLEGTIRATDLSRGPWQAEALSARSLLIWPLDQRGSGTAEFWGLRRGEGSASRLAVHFSRWNEWLSLAADLHMPGADLFAEGRLDPRGRLSVEQASVSIDRLGGWHLASPFEFTWASGTLAVDSLHLACGPARLRAGGRWIRSSGEVKATLELEDFEVSRLHGLVGRGRPLEGRCGLRLDAYGQLPDPQVSVSFSADSLVWGDLDLGRVRLKADWIDSVLAIGPLTLESEQQSARLPVLRLLAGRPLGSLLGIEAAPEETAAAGQRALPDSPWTGRLYVDRLDLARWAPLLGMRDPETNGSARTLEVRRSIAGRPVPIRVLAPWDLGPATAGACGLGGTFTATVTVAGTPRAPELLLEGAVEDLSLARLPLGSLAVDLTCADSLIKLRSLTLADGGRTSCASGSYPFVIQMLPFRVGSLDRPVSMEAELTDLNLALLSGFTRWLPDAHGRLSGDLTLAGTGTRPKLGGTLRLSDGGFRIPGRSERIYGAEAEVVLGPEGAEIRSFSARSGPRGTLTAKGHVAGPGEFDITAEADNVRIFQEGKYEFLVKADELRAVTKLPEGYATTGGGRLPHLTGDVEILRGTYALELGGGGGGALSPQKSPWVINLNLSAPGTIRISQTNAKVDVGESALHLTYRWPYWNASGNLSILGGTYRLFNNNFTIRDGTVAFLDTGTGLDVTVEVTGETHVTTAATEEGAPEAVMIEVQIQGKPDALQVSLSSVPPYSPEEIAELLSYGRFRAASVSQDQGFLFNVEAQGILLNTMVGQIESSLIEQFPLFSHVAVETGATGTEPWRVSLQQFITPAITGSYSQEVYRGEDWELSLHYRLSRILYLRAGVAHQQEGTDRFTDEYSLDLKCRFEY